MTRITFGVYKAGVRDSRVTFASFAERGTDFPTPFAMASAAIVRYHREEGASAWRQLDRSLARSSYWGAPGTPQAGWADAIRHCFRVYWSRADDDSRSAFVTGLNRDIPLPPHDLRVYVDVILLDPRGYVPRIVLWDANQLTAERARLYAAPAWRVAEDELGSGRVPEVEVWHLRSGLFDVIGAEAARVAMTDAEAVVRRMVGS